MSKEREIIIALSLSVVLLVLYSLFMTAMYIRSETQTKEVVDKARQMGIIK